MVDMGGNFQMVWEGKWHKTYDKGSRSNVPHIKNYEKNYLRFTCLAMNTKYTKLLRKRCRK